MTKLQWGGSSPHQLGIDRGVFFPKSGPAEVWNGLVSVEEKEVSLRDLVVYQDGIKLQNRKRQDSFEATVQSYTLPSSFNVRQEFGFSYRVMNESGYEIHIVYNSKATPPKQTYVQAAVNPWTFAVFTTPNFVPIEFPDAGPTAHLIIDSKTSYSAALEAVEIALYGSADSEPYLPSPQEAVDLFDSNSAYTVVDNGDGSFTMTGPDEAFQMLDPTTFRIEWPSTKYISDDTYRVRSY